MTRVELSKKLAKDIGVNQQTAAEIVENVFNTMIDSVVAGEEFKYNGLFNLSVNVRKSRNGVNPKTQEKIVIPEIKVLKFKPSKILKDRVKGQE
jgi:nucleoid DNA-binding protein